MATASKMNDNQVILTFTKPSTEPAEVIRFHWPHDSDNGIHIPANHVLVTFLASPINPQDIMVIANKYPVKPTHQHQGQPIGGYDGVGRVVDCGPPSPSPSPTPKFSPGDLVIPRVHGLGTWRRWAVLPCDSLLRLPVKLPTTRAATRNQDVSWPAEGLETSFSMLRTVFLPAYFLIEDMRSLRPGDWVVLNAGNTCIAQLAAQFAVSLKGARVLKVVRDGHVMQDNEEGPIVTVTEEDLRAACSDNAADDKGTHPGLVRAKKAKDEGRMVLALDAAFGESGERLAGLLSRSGTFVNFGSLGGAEGVIHLTQKMLFWNDIRFRSFRLSDQLAQRSVAQQESLLAWFAGMLIEGTLKAPDVARIKVPKAGDESARAGDEFEKVVKEVLTRTVEKRVGAKKHVLDFGF